MKSMIKRIARITLVLLAAALPLAGCQKTQVDEQVQEDANRGADEAREAASTAAEETKEAVSAAGEAVEQGMERAGAEAEQAMEKAGAAAETGMARAAEALDDGAVTAKVKAKLIADPEVAALQIDVDTVDGAVTLTGTAATQALKEEAGKLAAGTEGVKSVKNDIQVTGKAG
jgi:osmotically-inducible protein OsmY